MILKLSQLTGIREHGTADEEGGFSCVFFSNGPFGMKPDLVQETLISRLRMLPVSAALGVLTDCEPLQRVSSEEECKKEEHQEEDQDEKPALRNED
jgi:hypothetical protein